ncbi:hypothetical protein Tco_0792062 [Tanacetum coccineum]
MATNDWGAWIANSSRREAICHLWELDVAKLGHAPSGEETLRRDSLELLGPFSSDMANNQALAFHLDSPMAMKLRKRENNLMNSKWDQVIVIEDSDDEVDLFGTEGEFADDVVPKERVKERVKITGKRKLYQAFYEAEDDDVQSDDDVPLAPINEDDEDKTENQNPWPIDDEVVDKDEGEDEVAEEDEVDDEDEWP